MRLYGDLAPWFHLLTAPEDYAAEAGRYRDLILGALPDAKTLLTRQMVPAISPVRQSLTNWNPYDKHGTRKPQLLGPLPSF